MSISNHGYQVSMLGTYARPDHLPLVVERADFDALLLVGSPASGDELRMLSEVSRLPLFLCGADDEALAELTEDLPVYFLPEELNEVSLMLEEVLSKTAKAA